jgi:hypothetical protein
VVEPRIEGERVLIGSDRRLSLEELGVMAERLPWVAAKVFIMPPHQYVVEGKLQDDEARETFEALRYACAHHPASWKAFFRAYKSRNRYLVIGDYRYWYTQIRAARMMNRCDRDSELENTRGRPRGAGVRMHGSASMVLSARTCHATAICWWSRKGKRTDTLQ